MSSIQEIFTLTQSWTFYSSEIFRKIWKTWTSLGVGEERVLCFNPFNERNVKLNINVLNWKQRLLSSGWIVNWKLSFSTRKKKLSWWLWEQLIFFLCFAEVSKKARPICSVEVIPAKAWWLPTAPKYKITITSRLLHILSDSSYWQFCSQFGFEILLKEREEKMKRYFSYLIWTFSRQMEDKDWLAVFVFSLNFIVPNHSVVDYQPYWP